MLTNKIKTMNFAQHLLIITQENLFQVSNVIMQEKLIS